MLTFSLPLSSENDTKIKRRVEARCDASRSSKLLYITNLFEPTDFEISSNTLGFDIGFLFL